MSAYTGFLIRRERLKQNLSQEGLAKGICAVSYLSKIEQGLVEPGQEIMDRLFVALGVEYVRDEALENEAQRQLERFFFLSEADEPYEEQAAFFDQYAKRLSCSGFALSYQVYRLCMLADQYRLEEAKEQLAQVAPFMDCMPAPLRRYVLIVRSAFEEESGPLLEQAAQIRLDSTLSYWQAVYAYRQGHYSRSVELAEKAYALACEEGNVHIMIWSSHQLGTCACNRYDLVLAERCYRRTQALTRGHREDLSSYMHYNLGSTYLEMGDNENALRHLSLVCEKEGDLHHNILQHQKMAILCMNVDRREEAQTHLARARALCGESERCAWRGRELLEKMVSFAQMLMDGNVDSAGYEELLLTLYRESGETYGHGFRQFYGRYLVDLYKRQRRYKDALRVYTETGEFSFG